MVKSKTEALLEDYGIGIVTKANEKYSPIIEVFVQTQTPTIGGDISKVKINLKGSKEHVEGKATTEVIWIGMDQPNRLTAPSMIEGEVVRLQRYKGTDIIIWTPMVTDLSLRKTEAVIYAWSCSPKNKVEDMDKSNAIFLEIDNDKKFIELSIPNNDGEPAAYNIKLDRVKGIFSIKDSLDNDITLNSPEGKLVTSIKHEVTINTERTIINATEAATINTKFSTVNATQYAKINSPNSEITGNLKVGKNIKISGSLSCSGSGHFDGPLSASTTPNS